MSEPVEDRVNYGIAHIPCDIKISDLQSLLAEKEKEIERSKTCSWCGSNDLVCGKAWKDERDHLKLEMAEQTKTIERMGGALDFIQRRSVFPCERDFFATLLVEIHQQAKLALAPKENHD